MARRFLLLELEVADEREAKNRVTIMRTWAEQRAGWKVTELFQDQVNRLASGPQEGWVLLLQFPNSSDDRAANKSTYRIAVTQTGPLTYLSKANLTDRAEIAVSWKIDDLKQARIASKRTLARFRTGTYVSRPEIEQAAIAIVAAGRRRISPKS